jgi:EAL domain-containing protein (putative c-di-GMP-specific phosphodiesterase class I)
MQNTLLDMLLSENGINLLFQPLYRLHNGGGSIIGLECLSRGPHHTPFEAPPILFNYIRRKRAEVIIDRHCTSIALKSVAALRSPLQLHINVHAATLARDLEFTAFLFRHCAAHNLKPSMITIDIVEHSPAWNGESFHNSIAALRNAGVSIALDDVGLGNSNYRMMLDCRPDLFKIDSYIVNGCDTDPNRRAVLVSVSRLAADMSAEVVAEGIETDKELNTVEKCGIRLVQGRFLCPPRPLDLVAAACLQRYCVRQNRPRRPCLPSHQEVYCDPE